MYTEQMQNELEILKTEERQLNDDLAVFEIKYIHSIEIVKLQEVRKKYLKIKKSIYYLYDILYNNISL